MTASPEGFEEVGVLRTFARMIALVSVMASAMMASPSLAQTNIDQGKSPTELFANACAACHKTTRGLANGRSSLTLSIFLREHYTASSDQAAALAAYVLNSGGNAPGPKPAAKGQEAKGQEPKGQGSKGQETKGQETKGQEAKGQEAKGQEAKGQEAKGQEAKGQEPKGQEPKGQEPKGQEPRETGSQEPKVQEARTPPPAAPQEPAPAAATPAEPKESSGPTTSAAAHTESEPSENAPVPRDNIPD
jgi:hypothetical protein